MQKILFITIVGLLFSHGAWAGSTAHVVSKDAGVMFIEGHNWTINQVLFGTCSFAKAAHSASKLGYSYGYSPEECSEDVTDRLYTENVISGPLGDAVGTNCYVTVVCEPK